MSLLPTFHKRQRRRAQSEFVAVRRGRVKPSYIEEKVAELRAMNAPEDVIEFVQSIPNLGVGRLNQKQGRCWISME